MGASHQKGWKKALAEEKDQISNTFYQELLRITIEKASASAR